MDRVARINPDGSLDTSFVDPDVLGFVFRVAIQTDRKILIGGNIDTVNGVARNNIARLNPNGSLDVGFDPNADGFINCMAVQANGQIIIAGSFSNVGGIARSRIARLNLDGSVDGAYNPVVNGNIHQCVFQEDGKLLLAGPFNNVGGNPATSPARLNADGTLDTSFNASAGNVSAIAVQADGKILIGGVFTSVNSDSRDRIARLNSDGTTDSLFNPGANAQIFAFAVQADGRILVGGSFTTIGGEIRNSLARLDADGTVDAGFNPDITDAASASIRSVLIQEDGKILAGGRFDTVGSESRDNFVRLTAGNNAQQSLQFINNERTIRWQRTGTGPELLEVRFVAQYLDDLSIVDLGAATRQGDAWVVNNLNLTRERLLFIQVQAFYGSSKSSRNSILASGKLFSLPRDESFCFAIKTSNGNVVVPCL